MLTTFNSRCPFHKRRCRCSHRATGPARGSVSQTDTRPRHNNTATHSPTDRVTGRTASATTIFLDIQSEANREQLRASLLHQYAPSGYAKRYAEWLQPRPGSRAMLFATDCLLILQYAHLTGAKEATVRYHELYGKAVSSLNLELAQASSRNWDNVVGTIQLLNMCSQFRIYHDGAAFVHRDGLLAILALVGPSAMNSPFLKSIILDSLKYATLEALFERRTLIFGQKDWIDALTPYLNRTPIQRLLLSHLPLSSILARVEQLGNQEAGRPISRLEIETLWTELCSGDESARSWLKADFCQEDLISVNCAERFPDFFQRLSHLPDAFPFPVCLDFRRTATSFPHTWFWVATLELESAKYRLLKMRQSFHSFSQDAKLAQLSVIKERCDHAAVNICAALPFLYTLGTKERFGHAIIYSKRWFEHSFAWEWSSWTSAVLQVSEDPSFVASACGIAECRLFRGYMLLP